MRKGKYAANHASGTKAVTMLLAVVLLLSCVLGGTLAWLTAKTDEVKNTFTTSDITVTLEETKNNFKMVPGWTIDKDPKATVGTGSEDCYLFVKVEETIGTVKVGDKAYTFGDFLEYTIADGWTQLTQDKDGNPITEKVYYRVVDGTTNEFGKAYSVLKDDQVTVKGTVTKEMMNAVTEGNEPKLTFTAYASQLYKTNKPTGEGVTAEQIKAAQFTAAQAWANVNPSTT